MQTRKFIIATVWIALASIIWSCNEDTPGVVPDAHTESHVKDKLLTGSNLAMSRLRDQGFGGPMGAIFGNFASSNAGRTNATPLSMIRHSTRGRVANDSADHEKPSCLTETWEDDGNGTYTYTLDFGDGCDYYGEFLKGKFTETGTYSETSFSSATTYTNFGGEDWTIDGNQSYSGTWESDSDNPENEEDSLNWTYNATYQFAADLEMSYMQYGYDSTSDVSTGEQLIEVDYVAQGAESVDESSYTVESRAESITVSTGESFSSNVDVPLFMDYECAEEDVWIFVSGIESGSYTYGDQSGTYSIDYGDGTCDNMVTVTENGVSEDVDLGEVWDDWEEECGKDDHD
jgi:hypothetical protein